ncbi:hypothetical protein E2C01_053655 [Portunus trituberculatus]|uniref:Uncharacterized protein n=1 Tax=Portunus trituberculatus TaxID=210409 RepID=A0A5B7GHR0_PORTR|nr:hypothetical protein [Portunus trituberculatus]
MNMETSHGTEWANDTAMTVTFLASSGYLAPYQFRFLSIHIIQIHKALPLPSQRTSTHVTHQRNHYRSEES